MDIGLVPLHWRAARISASAAELSRRDFRFGVDQRSWRSVHRSAGWRAYPQYPAARLAPTAWAPAPARIPVSIAWTARHRVSNEQRMRCGRPVASSM